MLRRFIRWRLAAAERELGVSTAYLRHILDVSLGSFLKFAKVLPLAMHRRALPAAACHVARIAAARHEDCGPCVQIAVNLAKKDGVGPEVLKAAAAGKAEQLPEDLAEVQRFAEAVLAHSGEEDGLRDRLRQRFGDEGLVELALAIASSRIFPTVKRALGYATSCARVTIET